MENQEVQSKGSMYTHALSPIADMGLEWGFFTGIGYIC